MDVTLINKKEMKHILEMEKVIAGVSDIYRMKANGMTGVWPHVCHDFIENSGVMDIKSGYVGGDTNLHGAKLLNSFKDNVGTDIPVFNGLLMVFDSKTGAPLGMMDASYITGMRTGAAGAIGVKTFARENSENLFILGAGKQAVFQIAATLILMPRIKKIFVCDVKSYDQAVAFADKMPEILRKDFNIHDRSGVQFIAVDHIEKAVKESDVIITITPSREPVIKAEWVKPGTHFSCIGADMIGKIEIEPANFRQARIFTDDKKQCIEIGEVEIPIKKGVIGKDDILGDIGQVLSGQIPGRISAEDITIFDATGIAILDLITAKIAIELATEKGLGTRIEI